MNKTNISPLMTEKRTEGENITSPSISLTEGAKYNFTAQREDYLTPREFCLKVLKANDLAYFDCDVCCSQFNIPAIIYYRKDGAFALNKKIGDEDGLNGIWYAHNWCNPPFSKCEQFIKKAVLEQWLGKTTYMLIPARTETAYWQNYILLNGKANRPNIEVEFLKKGLCFLDPDSGKPIQMKIKQKDGSYKFVDGVYKNPLALITFRGVENA